MSIAQGLYYSNFFVTNFDSFRTFALIALLMVLSAASFSLVLVPKLSVVLTRTSSVMSEMSAAISSVTPEPVVSDGFFFAILASRQFNNSFKLALDLLFSVWPVNVLLVCCLDELDKEWHNELL